MVLDDHLYFLVQLVDLVVLRLDDLLEPLLLGLFEDGHLLLLLDGLEERHGGELHLRACIGEFLPLLGDDGGDAVLEVPNFDHELVDLHFKIFAHVGFLLDF